MLSADIRNSLRKFTTMSSQPETIDTITVPLEEQIARFAQDLPEELSRTWRMLKPAAHLGILEEVTDQLSLQVAQIGAAAELSTDDLGQFVIYEWLEEAKEFLLLLRNVFFEEKRAQLMVYEERLDEIGFAALKAASRNRVEQAAEELLKSLEDGPKRPTQMAAKKKKWALQRSPWPVYLEQLEEIREQIKGLGEQANDLFLTADIYRRVQELFRNAFTEYLDYLKEMTVKLEESLEPQEEGKSPSAAKLLRVVSSFAGEAPDPESAAEFIERLESLTKGLPGNCDFVAETSGGVLLRRDLNIQRATTNWLESELMSELQDFYLRRGQVESRLQIAIQTGENRLELSDEEAKALASQNIPQAMNQLARSLRRSISAIQDLEKEVIFHLDKQLFANHAYRPGFLQLDMQATISQYRRYQRSGIQQIRDWAKRQWRTLRNLDRESKREEQLSFSERVVRLVRARSVSPDYAQYSSMFLTQGYTGESFRVGRDAELSRVAQMVDDWGMGYRGTVLITGQRMSGKTFFGELIAHRHFSNNFITLAPGVRIELEGRIMEPTRDLKAAVEFVVRHAAHRKMMIWIDNLSNWRDEETPLISDVQSLLETIDYHSNKFFFVASVGTELHAQLQQYTEIDRHFQAILPMPAMSLEELQQAIRIRHGATQLELIDKEGEALTGEQIDRLVAPICRASRGHIGNALRLWAYSVELSGEESVVYSGVPPFAFPEELSQDSGLLLRTILVNRVTNEYYLRKEFGPGFRDRFQPLVQRMLNIGILLRSPTGALEINPALVADVELLLERKGFVLSDLTAKNPTV